MERTSRKILSANKSAPALLVSTLILMVTLAACSKPSTIPTTPPNVADSKTAVSKPAPTLPSTINVEIKDGGPIVLTTTAAEFQLRPDGYIQASC